jgi:hypothetical protein
MLCNIKIGRGISELEPLPPPPLSLLPHATQERLLFCRAVTCVGDHACQGSEFGCLQCGLEGESVASWCEE